MTKPLLLTFNDTFTLPETTGLKFVLFKLMDGEIFLGYDWGFADFNGEFEILKIGSITSILVRWTELPAPVTLLW
jgi:hypothetical protein